MDADGTIHFYGNQDIDSEEDGKQVSPETSVTLSQVVAYINDQNAADQVKKLASQLTIQDKRGAGEASTANVLTQKVLVLRRLARGYSFTPITIII